MVIVFVIVVSLSGLKQEIASHHLKHGAGQAPDVCRCIVIGTYNDFWRTILTSLDLGSKVVVGPATVTHIADLNHHIFINLRSPLTLSLSLLLSRCGSVQFIVFVEQVRDRSLSIRVNATLLNMFFLLLCVLLCDNNGS